MPSSRFFLAAGLLFGLPGFFVSAQSESSRKLGYPAEIEGRPLSRWVPDLKNPVDPSVREEAIRTMLLFGSPDSEVVKVLIERTRDRDLSPRVRAVITLNHLDVKKDDVPRVVEAFARCLLDTQLVVRYQAALGLVRYGERCQAVIPQLSVASTALDNSSWEIRKPCVTALALAGRLADGLSNPLCTTALVAALKDPAYEVRLEAILGLGILGRCSDPAVQKDAETQLLAQVRGSDKVLSIWATHTLMALDHPSDSQGAGIAKHLKNPEVRIRTEAVRAIATLGAKARLYVSELTGMLNDAEPLVVFTVIGSLVALGPDAQPALETLAQLKNHKDVDPTIRLAASSAIDCITKVQSKPDPSITFPTAAARKPQHPTEFEGRSLAQWLPDLKNPDPSVREEAIRAVVLFGPANSDLVTLLMERTADHDLSPRVRAVIALTRLELKKEDLPRVIELLARRLLDDTQLVVRYHAALGLVRYGDRCQPVIPKLLEGSKHATENSSWEIRRACVAALAMAGRVQDGPADPRSSMAVVNALRDPASEVRREALNGLAHMGRCADPAIQKEAETLLLALVRGDNKVLSIWATYDLMCLNHPHDRTGASIARHLKNPEVRVRTEAARAVGMLSYLGKPYIRELTGMLKDPEPTVVLTVIEALGRLAPDAQPALEALGQLKNNKDLDVRIQLAAADAIEHISKVQGKR